MTSVVVPSLTSSGSTDSTIPELLRLVIGDPDIDLSLVSARRSSLHTESLVTIRRRVVLGRHGQLRRPGGRSLLAIVMLPSKCRVEILIAMGRFALCWSDNGEGDIFSTSSQRLSPTSRSA